MRDTDLPQSPPLSELGLLDAVEDLGFTPEAARSLALGSCVERDGLRYRVIEIRPDPRFRVLALRISNTITSPSPAPPEAPLRSSG